MQQYITKTIQKILKQSNDSSNLTIILPSKRAVVFVKNCVKKEIKSLHFLPKVISIEEFIESISSIKTLDNVALLFEFYKIYIDNTPEEKRTTFDEFSNWGSLLLQDFNEIDRFLIEPKKIFNHLKDIKRIENWFPNKTITKQTELTNKYISFYEYIDLYYKALYKNLLKKGLGYQGMQYREAAKSMKQFINQNKEKHFCFIGFNALNRAEELIFKKLLDNKMADIFFDIDAFFINEKLAASNFINTYKNKWHYFEKNKFNEIHHSFLDNQKPKKIRIIGIPKNVSQMKEVGNILNTITNINNTALVLANENLLPITLNSLPHKIDKVNITMGYPLKNMAIAQLIDLFFKLHQNKKRIGKQKSFYYKDVITILNHVSIQKYFNAFNNSNIALKISNENNVFVSKTHLLKKSNCNEVKSIISLIFSDWHTPSVTIDTILSILKTLLKNEKNALLKTYKQRFIELFQQLENLDNTYGYLDNTKSVYAIYKQLLSVETLAFKGEALDGLQVMGMLETRVLDFENIIITSVNEGFLPGGKNSNSFIPFDVKIKFDLPTYREKDAVFSYHFYRLLSRATNIYLLHNTEPDDYGSGEQSRFITQLEVLKNKLPHQFKKQITSPYITNTKLPLQRIKKNSAIFNILKEDAKKGFSPTSLTNYIYNPITFYNQRVLSIKKLQKFEETIAANTLGTIIHDTLENFYKPYIGKFIKLKDVINMKKNVNKFITFQFKKNYDNGDITKGKNLLSFEVAKQFIANYLNQEIALLKTGKSLKIIGVEETINTPIKIDGINFPVNLKGKVDRIDELDGVLRIIDYKTGKVEQTKLNIKDLSLIHTDHKYSKAFQVIMYAYIYGKMNTLNFDETKIESGIVSFKNLKAGFMKVNKKQITLEDITKFELALKSLINEIFTEKMDFIEKENLPY